MSRKQESLLPSSISVPGVSTAYTSSLYMRLKVTLESSILSGDFPVGSKFPTEHEICERYGVSRVTTRKALKIMEDDGVLVRMRSRGSFVRKLPVAVTAAVVTPEREPVAAHIQRMVEIRCQLPDPFPMHWGAPWFQRRFSQQFPGVRLVINGINSGVSGEERYKGGDLYAVNPAEFHQLRRRGLLERWSEVLGEDRWDDLLADVPADLVRYVGYDRIDHLLPLVYSPVAFIYNRELLEEAGVPEPRFNWSESEFFAACELLYGHSHSRSRRFFPFFCDFSSRFRWPFALYREGGRVWSEDGLNCELASPLSLEGIRFYHKMIVEKGWGRPYHGDPPGTDHSLFAGGHVAMELGTSYTVSKLIEANVPHWGILNVPEGRHRANISTNCLLGVSSHVRERELIAEFIDFIRQPDLLREQFSHWKMFNTSQRAMNEILRESSAGQRDFIESFLRLTPEINKIEYPASASAALRLAELLQLLWVDLENAEAHCEEISKEVNAMPELAELRAQVLPQ